MTPNNRIIALLWYTMCCLCGFVPNWVCSGQGALGALGRVHWVHWTGCSTSSLGMPRIALGVPSPISVSEDCWHVLV